MAESEYATDIFDSFTTGKEYWVEIEEGDRIFTVTHGGEEINVIPYVYKGFKKDEGMICNGVLVKEARKRLSHLIHLDLDEIQAMIRDKKYKVIALKQIPVTDLK